MVMLTMLVATAAAASGANAAFAAILPGRRLPIHALRVAYPHDRRNLHRNFLATLSEGSFADLTSLTTLCVCGVGGCAI